MIERRRCDSRAIWCGASVEHPLRAFPASAPTGGLDSKCSWYVLETWIWNTFVEWRNERAIEGLDEETAQNLTGRIPMTQNEERFPEGFLFVPLHDRRPWDGAFGGKLVWLALFLCWPMTRPAVQNMMRSCVLVSAAQAKYFGRMAVVISGCVSSPPNQISGW